MSNTDTNGDRSGRHGPSRRQFVSLGIGAFAIAVAPRLLRPRSRLVRRTVPVMGTFADIGVVHPNPDLARTAIDAAISALRAVERDMTWFRDDSEIGRANLAAATDAIAVSDATADIVTAALHWADATDGAFDPAIGKLVTAWDVTTRRTPPHEDVIRRFAGRRLHRKVEVGASGSTRVLRFHDADVALDLGGIAKGAGVDRAVDAIRAFGIRDAIINVGGDLFAMGSSEDGDPWRVGVRSPVDPSAFSQELDVTDHAIATSGDYEQGFEFDGRRYHHLIDTRTAEPRAVLVHTLTVAADDCTTADAAATALFGMKRSDAAHALARIQPAARIVNTG